jgi:hypothetical protein
MGQECFSISPGNQGQSVPVSGNVEHLSYKFLQQ